MDLPLASPTSCELRFVRKKPLHQVTFISNYVKSTEKSVWAYTTYKNGRREFKKGRKEVHGEQRSERPSVSDKAIAKIEEAMLKDRMVTVRELSETVPDVSETFIDKILTDNLGYTEVGASEKLKEDVSSYIRGAVEQFYR